VAIETNQPPVAVKVTVLRRIEETLGRVRSEDKFAPRTIDLDLLLYDDVAMSSDMLVLPDPDLACRPFLAIPVFELEPEDDLEKFVTEADYNEIRDKVLQQTGGDDEYQEVFVAGMQFSETALPASISENVADIYQEMKDLIMSFRTMNDEVMEQAGF
jgi:hypothetical protein